MSTKESKDLENQDKDILEKEETSPSAEKSEDTDNKKDESETDTSEEDPLAKLEQEMAELKDQHLRLFADFENYKRRTSKERLELFGTANQELMSALLPVLDDFKRALKNMDESASEGVSLIYNKLENTLKNKGLKPMEDTTGKEFNVDSMEAVTRIPAPSEDLKGKVVDEIESGYMLGNKILRYAKVVVGE